MFLLWHPSLTAINFSYTFPILETSATALCGTTGNGIFSIPTGAGLFHQQYYGCDRSKASNENTCVFLESRGCRYLPRACGGSGIQTGPKSGDDGEDMMIMMMMMMMMMMSQDVFVDKISRDLTDDCIVYALLVMLQRLICPYIIYICIYIDCLQTYIITYNLYKFSTFLICEDRLSDLLGNERILQTKRAQQIDSLTGCITATFTEWV